MGMIGPAGSLPPDRAMVAALPMDRGAPLRNRLLRQVVLYWGVAFLLYPIC